MSKAIMISIKPKWCAKIMNGKKTKEIRKKEQAIKYKDSPVYGAIHIEDKGLIYKAKMKGVLPNGEIDWELL